MEELDVRSIAPPKHTVIREKLARLSAGERLRILNDHDPRPLKLQLDRDFPGIYSFEYVESGPEIWRIDIVKRAEAGP